MRKYAVILPTFWTGETGKKMRGMGSDVRVLATYLLTGPQSNMIGIYYIPIPTMAYETGMEARGIEGALMGLVEIGFAEYDYEREMVYVPEMAKYQVDTELKKGDKRVKGIKNQLALFKGHRFVAEFKDRYRKCFHL